MTQGHNSFLSAAWKTRLQSCACGYKFMCWGLNSHWFCVVGDAHQPNSRVLYTHHKDSLLKVGWVYPQYKEFWPTLGFYLFHTGTSLPGIKNPSLDLNQQREKCDLKLKGCFVPKNSCNVTEIALAILANHPGNSLKAWKMSSGLVHICNI